MLMGGLCEVIGWCAFSFVVGAGVGYVLVKDWLRWLADVIIFIGLAALAWYFGVFTIVWHWDRILTWLGELWFWLLHIYELEGMSWFARKALYLLCGFIGLIWAIRRFRLTA